MGNYSDKYYIKEGYEESGPYSIHDLKAKGISNFTFVRRDNSDDWKPAETFQELSSLFKKKRTWLKWVVGVIIVLIIGIVVLANLPRNIHSEGNIYQAEDQSESKIVVPPPPKIVFNLSSHKKKVLKELFKSCNLSGENQQLVNSCNYSNEFVRNKAVSIAGQDEGEFNLGQVCDIFDFCYNNWKYVNDSKANAVVELASNTIENGLNGDCDDFAVLVCSMVLSIGGEARINYAYGDDSGHAFTEVNIGQTAVDDYIIKRYHSVYEGRGLFVRTDGQGNKWLNLDWFAKHPGGNYFKYNSGTTFYLLQEYCEDF
jgi:hypothetical protein